MYPFGALHVACLCANCEGLHLMPSRFETDETPRVVGLGRSQKPDQCAQCQEGSNKKVILALRTLVSTFVP